jgi:hypothetical protein
MCVTIPSRCRIQRMSHGFVYINSRPWHIIWSYRCSYTGIRIQLNVSTSLFAYLDKSMCVIIPSWCRIPCTSLGLFHINTGRYHVILFYCCSYTGTRNQHNVSPSLFDISRQFDVRYNPLLLPYPLHATRIRIYKHWTLSFHIILLLFIYSCK